jgi:protoheme IX farnesyltransferase
VIRDLVALTKPRISVLNAMMTAGGLALAGGATAGVWIATLGGTLLVVASANVLNMYLERDIDARMRRTRGRPLPSGRMAPALALGFGMALAAAALPLLTFGANALTGLLGAVALIGYVLVYTPLKQVTPHALLVGAIPGAMPPLLGWTAASGSVSAAGLALFAVLFVWQLPHFLAIALLLDEDYQAAGIKVYPSERGEAATRRAIVVCLALQLLVTLMLVPLGLGGGVYLAGAALLGALMLGLGVAGLLDRHRVDRAWARRLFVGTLVYLPALFLLLVVS